jgi:hypothetical protein
LWGTWHHYQPPLHYLLLCSLLWCICAPSSWSNDARHVSEATTTTTWVFWDILLCSKFMIKSCLNSELMQLELWTLNSELGTQNSELGTLNSKLRTLNSTHALG